MVSPRPPLELNRDLFVWPSSLPYLSIRPQPRMPICPAMSHDSPTNPAGTPSASKADKGDELDANIRNFAPVARIMKNALPDNAKIAKEAKECMQECVSEFISFITSEGK